MEHNPDKMTGWIWVGFTGLVAVSLAVNGVQALAGSAKFAYWHLGTLAIGFLFSWEYLLATFRSLLTNNHPKIQTEP